VSKHNRSCNARNGHVQSTSLAFLYSLHHLDDESREKTYLVMEFITLATILDPDDFDARIKEALMWLSGVLPPSDDKLGPLGGGYIQHGFFKEFEAPLAFRDVKALTRYVERVCV
jgi:hypothetical protein